MRHRKEQTTGTLLKVPNTPRGLRFLADLHMYATGGTRIRARPRGPRAKHAAEAGLYRRYFDRDMPAQFAEYFGVYIDKPKLLEIANRQTRELYEQARALADALPVNALHKQLIHKLNQFQMPGLPAKARRKISFEENS